MEENLFLSMEQSLFALRCSSLAASLASSPAGDLLLEQTLGKNFAWCGSEGWLKFQHADNCLANLRKFLLGELIPSIMEEVCCFHPFLKRKSLIVMRHIFLHCIPFGLPP